MLGAAPSASDNAAPSTSDNTDSVSVAIGSGNQVMMMPHPGTPGTPYFDGQNVTDFLDRFVDLCLDFRLLEKEKIRRFSQYCDMKIGQSIESMKEWQERDWKKFSKLLRKEYGSADQAQTYNFWEFLETFKDHPRSDEEDPRRFCRQYARISEELVKHLQLDNSTQIFWFVQGLPTFIKVELFVRSRPDINNLKELEFDDLLEKVLKIARYTGKLRRINNHPFKQEYLSHLADLCESKPKKDNQASDKDFFVPPVVPATSVMIVLSANSEALKAQAKKIQDDSMAFLTQKFDAIALSLETKVTKAVRAAHISSTYGHHLESIPLSN